MSAASRQVARASDVDRGESNPPLAPAATTARPALEALVALTDVFHAASTIYINGASRRRLPGYCTGHAGYGRTHAPRDPRQYAMKILCRDMVEL